MKKVKIAIIDSGISNIYKDRIKSISLVNSSMPEDTNDNIGHGTSVAYIINSNCDADIIMIKVFDTLEEINSSKLIESLNYVYKNLDIDIINLSLGTTCNKDKSGLQNICNKLVDKGVIILSSFSNDGAISYPAAFKNVIGIDTSRSIHRLNEYEYVEGSIINIRGANIQQTLPYKDGISQQLSGNSFITPHITAKIANIIYSGISKVEDIKNILRKNATKVCTTKDYISLEKVFVISEAVIFPFNKETRNIIKFIHLLNFRVWKICDLKYMKTCNKTCREVTNGFLDSEMKISNIDSINWEEKFDTFILGHVREISMIKKTDYIKLIIEKCIKYNKNLYAFDNLDGYRHLTYVMKQKDLKVYYPKIEAINIPPNLFGKLHNISIPVVGIFGTSAKQGKYNVQLKLRELFLEDGYNLGQIGSEPNALLFGMDYVYPNGYDGSVNVNSYEEITILNNMISTLEDEGKEVVLVGGQSQITYYNGDNICYMPTSQSNFLLGTRPDVIILCVNIYDDIEYIERSIKYAEGIVNSKVIGIVISPIKKPTINSTLIKYLETVKIENIQTFKLELSNKFDISVFNSLLPEDIQTLYSKCIKYFQ